MILTGTLINILTVLAGGALGMWFGSRLPERIRQTVIAGLGLFTGAIGLQMFFKTENALVVLGSLLLGGLLGEWWRVEDGLQNVGVWLERRFVKSGLPKLGSEVGGGEQPSQNAPLPVPTGNRFVRGFLTASLVFCVGPMTILGSIQDGLTGDYQLLAIKAVLDGFASLAFASSLGVGVLFSTVVILIYQGGISLLAAQAQTIITPVMMNEMTAVGGVILVGIAISNLLEIKPVRVGNFLTSLAIAPIIVGVLQALNLLKP